MARDKKPVLEQLATQAICLGADVLEIEYQDRREEVFAMKSGFGVGIANLASSSPQARTLRRELHALSKKKRRVIAANMTDELSVRIFDSFGGDAVCVEMRRRNLPVK